MLTSSFGANPLRLAGSPSRAGADEVCRAAVAVARAAAGAGVIVAGSLGPTGGLLAPYGPLDPGAVRAAYAQEAAALAAAGVDVLWVETMMDLQEALAAVDGAREAAPEVPVVATLVFARGRTMFGDRPADAAAALAEHGVAGVGANCGDGFASVEDVIEAMAGAVPGLHVIAKANAGTPRREPDGRTVYPATPDEAAAYARRVADAGATIIGGLLRDHGGPHRRDRGRAVRARGGLSSPGPCSRCCARPGPASARSPRPARRRAGAGGSSPGRCWSCPAPR